MFSRSILTAAYRWNLLSFLFPFILLFKELAIMKNLMCAGHSLYAKSTVVKKKAEMPFLTKLHYSGWRES